MKSPCEWGIGVEDGKGFRSEKNPLIDIIRYFYTQTRDFTYRIGA